MAILMVLFHHGTGVLLDGCSWYCFFCCSNYHGCKDINALLISLISGKVVGFESDSNRSQFALFVTHLGGNSDISGMML